MRMSYPKSMSLNLLDGFRTRKSRFLFFTSFLIAVFIAPAHSGTLEQAKQLHDRIAGVPASETTLMQMITLLENGNTIDAAYLAMESPSFYSTTLKLFSNPWTNEEQDNFFELNDYSATVIGIVRDDIDFRQILQGDILYLGKSD